MSSTIRILGIDPSLRNTGLAVGDYDIVTGELDVIYMDVVKTEKFSDGSVVRVTSDDLRCARTIVAGMCRVIERFKPAFASTEVSGFSQSARGMFTNGVCCGILASLAIPVIEVNALEVKLAAGGNKTSSKDFMTQWAVAKWPHADWVTRKVKGQVLLAKGNEHMADACAAIQAGLLTTQFAQAVTMMRGWIRGSFWLPNFNPYMVSQL